MATILPENQINQELNSSVHQFFEFNKFIKIRLIYSYLSLYMQHIIILVIY